MIQKEEQKWYSWMIIISIILSIFMQYSMVFRTVNINYGNWVNYIICAVLVISYILYDVQRNKIYVKDMVYIFLMILIFSIIRKQQILYLFVYCLAFIHLTPYQTIDVYRKGILYAVSINLVLAILTHNLYNLNGDTIALGFMNQNTAAYYIASIVILFSIYEGENGDLKTKKNTKWYFLLLVSLFITYVLFNDATATIFIILFEFVQYFFFNSNILKNKIMDFIFCVLPFFLLYSSYWLAVNFNLGSSWMTRLDQLLSGRINIWHYYFTRMPISLISTNRIFVVSAWGSDYTPHQGAFDGTYAYILYIIGILFALIYVIGLAVCNYKLMKYNKLVLLALMLSLELVAFSENTSYSYALSFTSIFAMLSFHKDWLKGVER